MEGGLIKTYLHYRTIAETMNRARNDINPSNLRCVCVLLNRQRLVSIGVNKRKTHPLVKKLGYKIYRRRYPLHAELDAWIQAKNKRERFDTMMVYRGYEANLPSCPCHICSMWIRNLSVRVVYTSAIGISIAHSDKLVGHLKEE